MQRKELRTGSFAVHATRGIIRDQKTRRRAMLILLAVAVLMIVAGSTFGSSLLEPREYPGRFILYWLACAWVTVSALLLALFDVLMVRRQVRALREDLERQFAQRDPGDPPQRDDVS